MTGRDPLALKPVIEDSSLTPGACRIIMYVWSLGEGEHEVPHSQFAALLNHPGEKRLARELKLATELGPLEREPGGRGHSDSYSVSPAEIEGLSEDSPSKSADLKDSPAENGGLNADSPAESEGLSDQDEGDIGGEGEGDGAPARGLEISDRAERLIEDRGEDLEGCRDTLRDYLHDRVAEDRQYPYVQKILGWMDGLNPSVFRKPDGRQLSEDRRTGVLADALNGLYAADEGQYSRPVGDPDNLRTKIGIVIQQWEDQRDYGRNGGGSGGSGGGQDREHREFAV